MIALCSKQTAAQKNLPLRHNFYISFALALNSNTAHQWIVPSLKPMMLNMSDFKPATMHFESKAEEEDFQ